MEPAQCPKCYTWFEYSGDIEEGHPGFFCPVCKGEKKYIVCGIVHFKPSKRRKQTMALTDYSNLEQQIADAPEPKTLPRGTEVQARIIAVNEGISDKNGCQWYMPVFDVPSDPMVIEFNAFFWDLADASRKDDQGNMKLEPKQFQRSLNQFKNFAAAFGIDYSRPFSWTDDLLGLEGWVILGVKKDDEYGDKNTISKFVTRK